MDRAPRRSVIVNFPQHSERCWAVLEEDHEKVEKENARLRAELEKITAQRDAILLQARCWADEAKTQRHTVQEVGAILGGIPDWGPIAAGVAELLKDKARLDSSCIMTHERDEFGLDYKCERRGLDLRAAIDDAIHARQSQEVET